MMNKIIGISSSILLSWYAIFRWIILDKSNQAAIDWLSDPMGNLTAILSIVYMLYTLYKLYDNKVPQNAITTSFVTPMLCFINFAFLLQMIAIFVKGPNLQNMFYLLLDIFILFYYTVMVKLCYMTNRNTNVGKCECLSGFF